MPKFAQLQQADPILGEVPIASKAKGHEAMEQLFGKVAEAIPEEAISIRKEHSQAMLMNATAQSNSIMTDAQIQMIKHPNNADDINKNMQESLDTVGQAPMTKADKSKFNYMKSNHKNELDLKTAQIGARQNQLENSNNYWGAYTQSMSQYSEAISKGDFKAAGIIENTILENSKGAVLEGVIKPAQLQGVNKAMVLAHSKAEALHAVMRDKNSTAVDFNKAILGPLASDAGNASEMQADYVTQAQANHRFSQMTQQDIDKGIAEYNLTPNLISNIWGQSPEKFFQSVQKMQGSQDAHAYIMSNPNHFEMQNQINRLDGEANLSTVDSSRLKVMKDYMKELKTGSFWKVMAGTSLGDAALQRYQNKRAAIDKSVFYKLSPETQAFAKAQDEKAAYNELIDDAVSICQGSHMDPEMCNPITTGVVNNVGSSFQIGGDPTSAMSGIQGLEVRNVPFLANQMNKGNQREVVSAVGFGGNAMSPEFSNRLILSNQEGVSFKALDIEGRTSDATIRAQISNNVDGIVQLFSSQGGVRNGDFMESAVNYVKYRALTSGDFTVDKVNTYVDEFTTEMNHAYDLRSGYHSVWNNSRVSLSSGQQDVLGNYAISMANNNFLGGGDGNIRSQAALSKTDFTMYLNDQSHVVVKDSGGTVYFNEPYSDHLMAAAHDFPSTLVITDKDRVDMHKQLAKMAPWHRIFNAR